MADLKKWTRVALSLGQLQHDLGQVHRWTRFDPEDSGEETGYIGFHGDRRRQNVCQHLVEICELTELFIELFDEYLKRQHFTLDWGLLRQAVRVHDFGEACHIEAGADTPMPLKTDDHDSVEYQHFCAWLDQAYPDFASFKLKMKRAFLLQFCLKGNGPLPKDLLADLKANCKMEALMFMAIEHWGYFLYALEQLTRFNNVALLRDVLARGLVYYDDLAAQLPGFSLLIWTTEMRYWATAFLEQHGTRLAF
jgi:hypothetical protein